MKIDRDRVTAKDNPVQMGADRTYQEATSP